MTKRFISPGAWFSMLYPSSWHESEDVEGTFLFYDPDNWTGNFRISAYKAEAQLAGSEHYGRESIRAELEENKAAAKVRVGELECAYSKETYMEAGVYYTSHIWITGIDCVAFECSFTVPKGESARAAEEIIASLTVRKDGQKYPAEVIPVRLSEIYTINEGCDRAVTLIKDLLKQDFQGVEGDLPRLQEVMNTLERTPKQKEDWIACGIAACVILASEIDGPEWCTLIDGNREVPVLHYLPGRTADPMQLTWSKIKAGLPCNIVEEYHRLVDEIAQSSENINRNE